MICVDASVAVKWVFVEPYYQQARALVGAALEAGERIVAPPLLPMEITNIVRQYLRRAKPPRTEPLNFPEAAAVLGQFLSLPVELAMPTDIHEQALSLAVTYGLPAVYDAHYVALAERLGCPLWTADRNLTNTLSSKLPYVRWIGDY